MSQFLEKYVTNRQTHRQTDGSQFIGHRLRRSNILKFYFENLSQKRNEHTDRHTDRHTHTDRQDDL